MLTPPQEHGERTSDPHHFPGVTEREPDEFGRGVDIGLKAANDARVAIKTFRGKLPARLDAKNLALREHLSPSHGQRAKWDSRSRLQKKEVERNLGWMGYLTSSAKPMEPLPRSIRNRSLFGAKKYFSISSRNIRLDPERTSIVGKSGNFLIPSRMFLHNPAEIPVFGYQGTSSSSAACSKFRNNFKKDNLLLMGVVVILLVVVVITAFGDHPEKEEDQPVIIPEGIAKFIDRTLGIINTNLKKGRNNQFHSAKLMNVTDLGYDFGLEQIGSFVRRGPPFVSDDDVIVLLAIGEIKMSSPMCKAADDSLFACECGPVEIPFNFTVSGAEEFNSTQVLYHKHVDLPAIKTKLKCAGLVKGSPQVPKLWPMTDHFRKYTHHFLKYGFKVAWYKAAHPE